MADRIELHRAINWFVRRRGHRRWHREWTDGQMRESHWHGHPVTFHEPSHPYVMASACRIERSNWHNRIHHSRARWTATDGRQVLEFGETWCSRFLVDPIYTSEPSRECAYAQASMCPLCEVAFHPSGLTNVCARLGDER